MSNNLLKGKKGIIFGALDENSIAWKTALKVNEQGGEFVLTNAPVAMRMGTINDLAKKTSSLVIPADATRVEDLEKYFNVNLDFADEDEVETVGGLVFSKINRIPKNNEEFNIDDIVNIKVLRANERKILTVQIRKIVN